MVILLKRSSIGNPEFMEAILSHNDFSELSRDDFRRQNQKRTRKIDNVVQLLNNVKK